jgi:putative copper export protein
LLTFAEPLGPTNTVVATCNGSVLPIGSPSFGADGLSLTVAVPNPMPRGQCNVVATLSAPDSTPNGSVSFSFDITADPPVAGGPVAPTLVPGDTSVPTVPSGATPTGAAAPAEPARVGGVLWLSRVVTALALAVLLGSLVLIVTAWPEGIEYILTVRFLRLWWMIALVGSVFTVVSLTAELTGRSFGSSLSPGAWMDLKESTPGLAALVRLGLTAACGWVVLRPERSIDQATQLPALAIPALAVATFGFSRTGGELAIIGTVTGVAHALAMAVWVGGIALLARVVLAGPGEDDLVHAVRGFGRFANPALLVTVMTGVIQAWRLDRDSIFGSSHGRVVLLKVVVVVAMILIGLATRQFAHSRLAHAEEMTAPLASRLRRATSMEAAGGVLVLMLSGWLLALSPPNISASAAGSDDYGYTEGRIQVGDLDVTVLLTGEVGRNGVRVEVASPATGLSNLVVTFVPPISTTAPQVVLSLPATLTGPGAVVLDVDEGVPLEAPGVWTLIVSATTPAGVQTGQKTFTLLG